MEGCFEVTGRNRHGFAGPVGEDDRRDTGEELLGLELSALADPASVGKVLLHGCRGAGPRLGRGDPGGDLELVGAADRLAHVARQAVGGDDAEPDAGDDADAGLLGLLVEVVEGAEHLEFVADVEVVDAGVEAGFGERGCGVEEWSGGVEYQVHVGQRRLQRGRVIQGQIR